MAEDAKVSKISELAAFASKMQGFLESVSKNSTALNNLMVQKLDELRKKLKKAEQLEAEAVNEYDALIRSMANIPPEDYKSRDALLSKRLYLENRRNKAKLMRSDVKSKVNVAYGATVAIIDATKVFQNKVRENVGKGKQVLKKSVAQLEQYNETNKKI